MADPRWRLRNTDYRYGHVCPICAGPKTLQAAKCFACFTDWSRSDVQRQAAFVRRMRVLAAPSAQGAA